MILSKPMISEGTPGTENADDQLSTQLESQLSSQQAEDAQVEKEKQYARKTGKIRKKEAKELASKNKSILSWLEKPSQTVKVTEESRRMDRLDDPEPEVESMEIEEGQGLDIIKAERLAQEKKKRWKPRSW